MKLSTLVFNVLTLAAAAEAMQSKASKMNAKSSKNLFSKTVKSDSPGVDVAPKAEKVSGVVSDIVSGASFSGASGMTKDLIMAAQAAWGEGIVTIASAYTNGGNYVKEATGHIETLYAYGLSPVLFKPTLAADQQFRPTFAGALSYFVANNNAAPEDKGFAIKGWTAVRFENEDILIDGNVGEAMGNYFFTTPAGDEVKVEYSFGYMLDAMGDVRINLHHSSLPYAPTPTITEDMMLAAQETWGAGIVKIASAHTDGGDYVKEAKDLIDALYDYETSPILFKPTLAADKQFRPTYEGALSYFVASNGEAPEDKGFAIKGWTAVRFENNEMFIKGDVGMAMGNYFFTKPDGTEAKVEYSFGYTMDATGHLRIVLHHSSLPYSPEE